MRRRDSRMRSAILGCEARCYIAPPASHPRIGLRIQESRLRILESRLRRMATSPNGDFAEWRLRRIATSPTRDFAFARNHGLCACSLKITCHGVLRFSSRKSLTKKSRFGEVALRRSRDSRMRSRDSRMRSAMLGCDVTPGLAS